MTENRRLLTAVYRSARAHGNAAIAAQCAELLAQAGFPPPDAPAPSDEALWQMLRVRPGAHPKIRALGLQLLSPSDTPPRPPVQ